MPYTIQEIKNAYNVLVGGIDEQANAYSKEGSRAYGGAIRAAKGILVESIAKNLIEIAWNELGECSTRLSFNKQIVRVPIKPTYLTRVRPIEVAEYIKTHLEEYFYGLKTDIHVCIDGQFIMGIECKAYTENAMLKRILVDFSLLKQVVPNLKCVLLQLESQLSGDYSQPLNPVIYGSPSTHTLLSYFDVDLNIITLLEGERKVDQPIHKQPYYKALTEPALVKAVTTLKTLLLDYIGHK